MLARTLNRTHRMFCWLLLLLWIAPQTASAQDTAPTARTKVIVLGSGTPAADPERFGPAVVVVVDSTAYLFDAGVGVVRRWAAALRGGVTGLHESSLRRLFVTHLHSDHTLGYPELIFTSWTLDRAAPPLEAYGPRGLREMTDNIVAAYAQDVAIRTGERGESAGAQGPAVRVHEIEPGVVYSDSLVAITAFAVQHGTWPQAFGYRIQTPDKVIVLSGDAALSMAIAEQCNGCDLLLHEGGFLSTADAHPYFRRFHTTAEELATLARAASPGLLVLYHQRSAGIITDKGYRVLRSLYDGAFVVARDLDVFY